MQRIDTYPTHTIHDWPVRAGRPLPFGATEVRGGVNFAVFSRHATGCTLVLFPVGGLDTMAELPFPPQFRVGDVYAMIVFGLDAERVEYGFRMDGPYAPHRGHRFDRRAVLLDPYARSIGGRDVWGAYPPNGANPYVHRARLVGDDFDWEDDRPLETPIEDLVLYEMHVRGFTRHPSSGVRHPGTFAGVREKIPYLQALGVNAVELLPIFEFDEFEFDRTNPLTGDHLLNYWGYSTVGFFAPKAGYAATGRLGMQHDEFKALVKAFHRAGIEVILDVVFNHTAEGDARGPTISFRGLDNKTYYMLAPDGRYRNYSGTGNTLNCNHPVVRNMVLDCLRYWAAEYHIDGFRFDLAAILGRDQNGTPLANPPLLEALAADPVLAHTKLIAEAWDAGGLYQVGTFPAYGRWAEWNGKYRDTLRRFLRGDAGMVPEVATRLMGSADLYAARGPGASVNFITCHDGFSLHDLFSYNTKRNVANGENNRDGTDANDSWNCGAEGTTSDPHVLALRARMMRNATLLLLVSQGVPMLHMGDEVAHTKHGNNNTYCHDNDLNWLDWAPIHHDAPLLRFVQACVAFRRAHPVLRARAHFTGQDAVGSGYPDVSWHGVLAWQPDWRPSARTLAFMLDGAHASGGATPDDTIYVAANMHAQPLRFELPALPPGRTWHVFADTAANPPWDAAPPGHEPRLPTQDAVTVGARSVAVLVGR